MTFDRVFRAGRMVVGGVERPGCVGIRDGVVAAVESDLDGQRVVELGADEVLLPGLVDTHVHVNDPGRTEWETFSTATRAAAAGGVTTIIDMPLNSLPPTVDRPALAAKRAAADGRVYTDVGFWGGAVPGNLDALAELHDDGVFGFKCFLSDSGVDEFGHLGAGELEAALRRLADLDAPLIVHAEDPGALADAPASRRYRDFLDSRPRAAETRALTALLGAARRTGARVHVLHLSASDGVPILAAARQDGIRVTAETCPHYLTLAAEEIPDGATAFKCCPPIRERANQDALWDGLRHGVIDCVVSDHSPATVALKQPPSGDFATAWGGISGLQLGLPAVWTAAGERGVPLTEVVSWLSSRPADLVGLRGKGRIAVGQDADLAVFAPDEEFTVDAATLWHRNPVSAYHGRRLRGMVRSTWLRGVEIGAEPRGRLITRGRP